MHKQRHWMVARDGIGLPTDAEKAQLTDNSLRQKRQNGLRGRVDLQIFDKSVTPPPLQARCNPIPAHIPAPNGPYSANASGRSEPELPDDGRRGTTGGGG